MTYISEKYQLGILEPYLEKKYSDYVTEAVVYSAPIDILARHGDDVISIELKSRNHKQGIAQGRRNTAYSDYSYLSVWSDQVTDYLLNQIENTPLGLIAVDDNVEIVQNAQHLEPNFYAKEVSLGVLQK